MKTVLGALIVLSLMVRPTQSWAGLPPPSDDKSLVRNNDIVLVGEQVNAVTVKVKEVLKGTCKSNLVTLCGLEQHKRTVEPRLHEKTIRRLNSREVVVFINGRTTPCSLARGGVRRFSSQQRTKTLYLYRCRNTWFPPQLYQDPAKRTKEQYLKQLKTVIEDERNAYNEELLRRIETTDFSSHKSTSKFMSWARQRTRWGYDEGVQELLRLAAGSQHPARVKAVWVLREIRDPASAAPLFAIVKDLLNQDLSLFDHIRALGAIGGDDVLPFLVRLTTQQDIRLRHSKVSCAAVHGLRLLAQHYDSDTEELKAIETALLRLDPKPICVREALGSLATQSTIEKLESFASKMKNKDRVLFRDARERVEKARARDSSRREKQAKLEALRKADW